MDGNIVVGISDLQVAKAPKTIVTYALGSCVGICLYDSSSKVGGLAHIMLPNSLTGTQPINKMKYADSAIPELIRQMEQKGAIRRNLVAKIAGGAQMFEGNSNSRIAQIGKSNTQAVKEVLQSQNIYLKSEDTGANYGRSVFMNLENGSVTIKSVGNKIKEI